MAILKVSSQEESGADAFSASVRYVSDLAKTNETDAIWSAQSFEDLSVLNRYAHGQENRDRYYKHNIVALELEWPSDTVVRKSFVDKLYQVISAVRAYYNDKSFRSIGYVHQDTAHPHIHLLVDTCNVETGRQLSQSPKDLEDFKLYVSEQLMQYGLNETIRMNVSVVSEEEMLADDVSTGLIEDSDSYDDYDDYDYCQDDYDYDYDYDYGYEHRYDSNYDDEDEAYPDEDYVMSPSAVEEYLFLRDQQQYEELIIGTEEHPGFSFFKQEAKPQKEMCILSTERKPIWEDPEPEKSIGKTMCVIVDSQKTDSEEQPEGKVEMIKVIDKSSGRNS